MRAAKVEVVSAVRHEEAVYLAPLLVLVQSVPEETAAVPRVEAAVAPDEVRHAGQAVTDSVA